MCLNPERKKRESDNIWFVNALSHTEVGLTLDWVYIGFTLLKRISLPITNQTVKILFGQKQKEWIQPESRSVQTTFRSRFTHFLTNNSI